MAPKKNVDKTAAPSKKKILKKALKIKKEKPKFKVPSIVKYKIPTHLLTTKTEEATPAKCLSVKKKPAKKQRLSDLAKIDLCNEVAMAQLPKPKNKRVLCPTVTKLEPAEDTVKPATATVKPAKIIKKNGTKRKVIANEIDIVSSSSVTSVTTAESSEDAFVPPPKKRPYVRKAPLVKKKLVLNKGTKKKRPLAQGNKIKIPKGAPITNHNTEIDSAPVPKKVKKSSTPKNGNMSTRTRLTRSDKDKITSDVASPSCDIQNSPSHNKQGYLTPQKEEDLSNLPKNNDIEACSVNSRKSSMTGTSDCPSWTKDISSSSTTTCITVRSTDFVCIDNKIPILKLTNIDQTNIHKPVISETSSESDDSDSTSSDSSPRTPLRQTTPEIDCRSLALSTSSSSIIIHKSLNIPKKVTAAVPTIKANGTALSKLTSKLKVFDTEIVDWVGYDRKKIDVEVQRFQDRIFRKLKEESELIAHCKQIKQVFSDTLEIECINNNYTAVNKSPKKTAENNNISDNTDFVVPVTDFRQDILHDRSNSVSDINRSSSPNVGNDRIEDSFSNISFGDNVKNKTYDHNDDDDDALSLFAESLAGIDISRVNSSVNSVNNVSADDEEYIPKPVTNEPVNKINYVPSKIVITSIVKYNSDSKKNVCEKQSADSTSLVNKDSETESYAAPVNYPMECSSNLVNNSFANPGCTIEAEKKRTPSLMASYYKSVPGARSTVFRGYCFYYLINSCKQPRCRYLHAIPDGSCIMHKLMKLSEEVFIQEYILLRSWPILRRRYGMYFVAECQRRDLTRILIEMAIDFYTKTNEHHRKDIDLRIEVIEFVLLHLNAVDLEQHKDLLMYNVQQEYLCDIFMRIIANTQNFSRFKLVFIKLTSFMWLHRKWFDIHVATLILERVCILRYEQPLTEALFHIIKHTDRSIFDNSLMGHYEQQLSISSPELYEQFLSLKRLAGLDRPVLKKQFDMPHQLNMSMEPGIGLVQDEREQRYTSPDTTNRDNMNKATEEPVIIRTLHFNNRRQFLTPRSNSNSNSSMSNDSSEEIPSKPTPNFKKWRGSTVFSKVARMHPDFGARVFPDADFSTMIGPDFH